MNKVYGVAIVGVILAYFAATGMQHETETLDKIAVSMKLNEVQRLALGQCHRDMLGNTLTFPDGYGNVTHSKVPDEICACQAKSMASVFKPEQFAEHVKVVNAVVDKKSDVAEIKLDAESLRSGYSQKSAASKLMISLGTCASEYRKAEVVRMRKAAIDAGRPELAAKLK